MHIYVYIYCIYLETQCIQMPMKDEDRAKLF